jgi:DNA-binding NtrC family response regulator
MSKPSPVFDKNPGVVEPEYAIRVLLIDEEGPLAESCLKVLVHEGYGVRTCSRGLEARAILQREAFDVVLIDAHLSQMSALSIMGECLNNHPETRVILMSGNSSVEASIAALKAGAWSYLAKPFSADHLKILLARARHEILTAYANAETPLPDDTARPNEEYALLGRSPAFMRLIQLRLQSC